MGIPMVFQDDGFHAEGLLWMLGMAVAWGVLLDVCRLYEISREKSRQDCG